MDSCLAGQTCSFALWGKSFGDCTIERRREAAWYKSLGGPARYQSFGDQRETKVSDAARNESLGDQHERFVPSTLKRILTTRFHGKKNPTWVDRSTVKWFLATRFHGKKNPSWVDRSTVKGILATRTNLDNLNETVRKLHIFLQKIKNLYKSH